MLAENWTKDRKDNSAETEIMASNFPTFFSSFFYEEQDQKYFDAKARCS